LLRAFPLNEAASWNAIGRTALKTAQDGAVFVVMKLRHKDNGMIFPLFCSTAGATAASSFEPVILFPWRLFWRFLAVAILSLFCQRAADAQTAPEVVRGQQWLLAQTGNGTGFASGPEQHAGATQAAAEAVRTIKLNNTVPTGLVDQVAADDGTGTEHLASSGSGPNAAKLSFLC
jgi:hypothetical protein